MRIKIIFIFDVGVEIRFGLKKDNIFLSAALHCWLDLQCGCLLAWLGFVVKKTFYPKNLTK